MNTGSGGGGLTTVATDATISGDGSTGDPLSIASYVGPAFQSASYLANDRELFFQALDSAEDQRLPLTFIGILHGVGGDTFITNEAFHFGDSAIIGHLYYLYTHRVTANYSPTSILNAPAGHFMNFPILDNGILRTGQIAAGGSTAQVLTRTAAGHAWQDATGGGLSAVATDATLDGDGTTGDPLLIPLASITEPLLNVGNAPQNLQVLSWDGTNSQLLWKNDETAAAGTGLDQVHHSAEFTGTGTAALPLTLVDDSITEGRLVIHNAPADGQVLAYDLPNTRMEWITPAAGGASDGVLSALALANDGTVTATLTVGADVTGDFSTGIDARIAAAARTPLTNTDIEDETDTTTIGPMSPSVFTHGVEYHEAKFAADDRNTTVILTSRTYTPNFFTTDDPVKWTPGSVVDILIPAFGTHANEVARINITADDGHVAADVGRLNGGVPYLWNEFVTGTRRAFIYHRGLFFPFSTGVISDDTLTGSGEEGSPLSVASPFSLADVYANIMAGTNVTIDRGTDGGDYRLQCRA